MKARQVTLVNPILSAIPIHKLLVLASQKKVIKQADKIRRGFLWVGRKEVIEGHCAVNRGWVCRPLAHGNHDIQDFERMGMALRLHWIWFGKTDPSKRWHGLDLKFSAPEHALFFASTYTKVSDDETCLFWEDRWLNGLAVSMLTPSISSIPKRCASPGRLLRASWLKCGYLTYARPPSGGAPPIRSALVCHRIHPAFCRAR